MGELGGLLADVELPLLTERLLLRLPRPSDAQVLSRAGNDPRVARGTFLPHPFTPRAARANIQRTRARAREGEGMALLIEDRRTGRAHGLAGFWLRGRGRDPDAVVFYWLAPASWGRGIASEALGAVLDLCFGPLSLHRVSASVLAFNDPSMRVLRRAGFRREGRVREVRQEGRHWEDELIFGMLAKERPRGSGGAPARRPAPAPPRRSER